MKCVNCGADIPSDTMNCIYCGHSVQMVPDYNPLDDVLEEEVRSRIDNHEPPSNRRMTETRDTRDIRDTKEAELKKRRDSERRRALRKKRRNMVIGILAGIAFMIILITYLVYVNSYTGQMNAGDRAYDDKSYIEAIEHYENAANKKPSRNEPYDSLIDVYTTLDDIDNIEATYLIALEVNSDNIDFNIALMEFYVAQEQQYKISDYLTTIENENVKNALVVYESTSPEFSLSSGTFDDVQELTMTVVDATIYYTLDGSEPSESSMLYEEPLQISEGTTEVKAIAINDKGVTSNTTYGKFTVELPIPDAPIVSPSTGQYTENTYITINVPEGATAYYTTDSSHPYENGEPSESATKYKTSIAMPEGNTILSVVIVSGSGKVSDVTMRNYELIIDTVDEEIEMEDDSLTSDDVDGNDSI